MILQLPIWWGYVPAVAFLALPHGRLRLHGLAQRCWSTAARAAGRAA